MAASSVGHDISSEIPKEVREKLGNLNKCLSDVELTLEPLLKVPIDVLHSQLTSLEKAKLDLMCTYAANSLIWVHLKALGHDPNEQPIKEEISRLKTYTVRLKELEDRPKAHRLDIEAGKRMIKGALWHAASKKDKPLAGVVSGKDRAGQGATTDNVDADGKGKMAKKSIWQAAQKKGEVIPNRKKKKSAAVQNQTEQDKDTQRTDHHKRSKGSDHRQAKKARNSRSN